MLSNFIEKIKRNKKIQFALIACFLIIVLLIFFVGYDTQSKSQTSDAISEYVLSLENRLSKSLSEVKGVGDVSVVITVESGMENVIAMKTTTKETSTGHQIEEEPIIVNGKTVTLKEKYPIITGVLVVAEGADSISVLTRIQQATMSLLDIKLEQIEILAKK